MRRSFTGLMIGVAFCVFTSPAAAAGMPDCTYTGKISGKTATIVVKAGEPVSYRWGSYNAKSVYRQGDAITVDKGTLENLSVGATQSGKPAFQGDWRYKGSNTKVTFICR